MGVVLASQVVAVVFWYELLDLSGRLTFYWASLLLMGGFAFWLTAATRVVAERGPGCRGRLAGLGLLVAGAVLCVNGPTIGLYSRVWRNQHAYRQTAFAAIEDVAAGREPEAGLLVDEEHSPPRRVAFTWAGSPGSGYWSGIVLDPDSGTSSQTSMQWQGFVRNRIAVRHLWGPWYRAWNDYSR